MIDNGCVSVWRFYAGIRGFERLAVPEHSRYCKESISRQFKSSTALFHLKKSVGDTHE